MTHPPLAEAKLAAPRPRAGIVDRARIRDALDAGAGTRLTLVAAPAGSGKTTAVVDWTSRRAAALAWVTLDAGDDDPVRLWTYTAAAANRVRDGLGRGALQQLGAGASIDSVVDVLTNGLASFRDELVIVLDDLHTLSDAECVASIDRAIEHLPPNARLVVLSRADPALKIAHLRARGALLELRADDLAFTEDEAFELVVRRGGLDLDAQEVAILHRRTEGWPAALFLATLWLRSVDDPRRAVRDFGGDHRFVADYLSTEVLGALDAGLRDFLVRASVLRQFTAELCDDLLDRDDSAATLAELERVNLFVGRLERGDWYRVHPLFAEYAALELASVEPGAKAELHRRAAGWFSARGLPDEAVEHAAAAGDDALVADILVDHHRSLLRSSGGARMLVRRVETLPDAQLVEHPELAAAAASAAAMIGAHTIAKNRFLALVDRARPDSYADAVAETVRAATVDGDVAAAVRAGRRAVETATGEADELLVGAFAAHAHALYFAGEADEAWATALRAVQHPSAERQPAGHVLARTTLALVAAERGRVASARSHAEQARTIVGRAASSRSWLGANASAALGVVVAAEDDPTGAERELAYAEHAFRDEVATVHHTWVLALLAETRCRRGRLRDAKRDLDAAAAAIAELADAGRVTALVASVARELEETLSRAATGEVRNPPSTAELAVLKMLATSLSAREISGELFISHNTVRTHTRALYRKLGVSSRADAVERADAMGFLA